MIKEILAMAALTAALLIVGSMDRQDAEKEQSTYCEMVAIWENDPRPEIDRAGWPPFKDIQCDKIEG